MDFNLHYKPGSTNIYADSLSRLTCSEEVKIKEVQAILKGCLEQPKFLWEAYACSARVTEELKEHLAPSGMGAKEWRVAQSKDPTISTIKKMLESKMLAHRRPSSRNDAELKAYLYQRHRFKIRNGVVYRYTNNSQRPDRNSMQLCLPKAYRKEALEGSHDNVDNFALDRTIDLLRDIFYWPHKLEQAKEYVGPFQIAKEKHQLAPLPSLLSRRCWTARPLHTEDPALEMM